MSVLALTESGASRSQFIFHRFSTVYKYSCTSYRIITKHFQNLLVGIGSALPQFDTKLDCTKFREITLLRFRDAVTKHIYTSHNRTTCIHVSKFKLGGM
jgi:hypothetical protein